MAQWFHPRHSHSPLKTDRSNLMTSPQKGGKYRIANFLLSFCGVADTAAAEGAEAEGHLRSQFLAETHHRV